MVCEIKNSDALSWLKYQEPGSFQAFILDPPYNVGYKYGIYSDEKPWAEYFHEQMLILALCEKALKKGGSIFYLNYPETTAEIWARVDFLKKTDLLPWVYHAHVTGGPFRKASRLWAWFSKGEPFIAEGAFQGEYQNPEDKRVKALMERGQKPQAYDWIDLEQVKNASKEKRNHPCQVPERMVQDFIKGVSQEGDLIGDCFLGSGTTALCAKRLNRGFKGCELDPEYVAIALEALKKGDETPLFTQANTPNTPCVPLETP